MRNRTDLARRLRSEPTRAERKMWSQLRDRRFLGLKFKRQVPIDRFVVDFICVDANLIIEIDGGQHAERADADRERTRILESMGYLVLRFWNNDVLQNIDGVLESMISTLQPERLEPPHPAREGAPTSPRRGEGS
ncbi:MAG TPA: endonuclease domain-containing protein [Methyloceanibacter sp.]|nr:endonuclease domain-containing protein [Methyloceanibacter sp.]